MHHVRHSYQFFRPVLVNPITVSTELLWYDPSPPLRVANLVGRDTAPLNSGHISSSSNRQPAPGSRRPHHAPSRSSMKSARVPSAQCS